MENVRCPELLHIHDEATSDCQGRGLHQVFRPEHRQETMGSSYLSHTSSISLASVCPLLAQRISGDDVVLAPVEREYRRRSRRVELSVNQFDPLASLSLAREDCNGGCWAVSLFQMMARPAPWLWPKHHPPWRSVLSTSFSVLLLQSPKCTMGSVYFCQSATKKDSLHSDGYPVGTWAS